MPIHNKCCPVCPDRRPEKLTFSNCTPVSGSSNPANPNTIFHVGDEIDALVAFSLENTGRNNILLTVIFSNGDPNFATTVEVGSSIALVFAHVFEITVQSPNGLPISGIFNYQNTYTLV